LIVFISYRYIDIQRREQEILKGKSVKQYLIDKLNTDEAKFEEKLKTNPTILTINILKMNEIINILHQNGITNDDLLNNLRIFTRKVETIRKRIEILKEANIPLKIYIFMHTQKMFDNYMKQKLKIGVL